MKAFTFTVVWPKGKRGGRPYMKKGVLAAATELEATQKLATHPLFSGFERIAVVEVVEGTLDTIVAGS